MGSIDDDKTAYSYASAAIGEAPPPGLEQRWAVRTMLKVAKLLEVRQQEVAYALMEVAVGYLEILSAAVMVCLVILRSNTRERDALICKLLGAKLQELQPDPLPSSRPHSQSPASPEVPSSGARH